MTNNKDNNIEIVIVNGVEGVDKPDAMRLIGYKYPKQLADAVRSGNIKKLGVVVVQGKTTKNIFHLGDVRRVAKEFKPRGTDLPIRWQVSMHEDDKRTLEKFLTEELSNAPEGTRTTQLRQALIALTEATNLTKKSKEYMAEYLATKKTE